MKKYEFLEHTADIQFIAFGKSLKSAFKNAMIATTKSFCDDKIKQRKKIKLKIKGNNLENLLYNLLEELIFIFDTEYFILGKVLSLKLNEKEFKIEADLIGDENKNYKIKNHIKAITYSDMEIKKKKGIWNVKVTLDV